MAEYLFDQLAHRKLPKVAIPAEDKDQTSQQTANIIDTDVEIAPVPDLINKYGYSPVTANLLMKEAERQNKERRRARGLKDILTREPWRRKSLTRARTRRK